MASLRRRSAALCLALAAAGCGSARPPEELAGLWSAGDAACEAGIGVRFTANAIEAIYDRDHQTLFERPEYDVVGHGEDFRVRISYALPQRPGGARIVGAHGVLVLVRNEFGIAPEGHSLIDPRTGAARMRIADDPAEALMTLRPCAPSHPFRAGLRGRGAA